MSGERLALEVRRARGPFGVLLVLLVGGLVSVAVIARNVRAPLPWQDRYVTRVGVDDAKGVVPGKQELRISGVPVGRIERVELAGGRPVLEVSMERRFAPLYRDARLRLRPKTPLQDLYLNVEDRGHGAAGVLGEHDTLQAARTRTPVDIGHILNTFNAGTRARFELAVDGMGRGLADHGARLRAALVELSPFLRAARRMARETAVRGRRTRRLVHNFRLMTEELGRRDRQVTGLVRGGAATFSALGSVDRQLDATIAELPPMLRRLRPAFAALRAATGELDPAFDALQPTARAMPSGLRAMRDFAADARPAFAALRTPVRELTPLARALRPTAVGLHLAFERLRPQPPRLDRVTAMTLPCLLAVEQFFQNTVSVAKFYDAASGLARVQQVFSRGFIGGESAVRDPNLVSSRSCAPAGLDG